MAALARNLIDGLRRKLQAIAQGVTEVAVAIREISRAEGEIGYTSRGNSIHLSFDNPIMDEMTTSQKIAFITGVFAHELMHRIITDFQALEKIIKNREKHEAYILKTIINVMEDPAIEYQAPMYIGGHMLNCLSYTVMTCYKQSPQLQNDKPFNQFINAMIMYGDGGIIKGEFTSKEAKEYFYKVLPIVDRCITERSGKKRIQLGYDVFLLTKPLWEKEVEDAKAMEQLMNELEETMRKSGKGTSGDSGSSGMNLDGDEDAAGSSTEKKQKRRKVTYRKISKEEMEELKKNGSSDSGSTDGDVEILYCDEEIESDDMSSGASAGGENPAGEKPKSSDSADEGDGSENKESSESVDEDGKDGSGSAKKDESSDEAGSDSESNNADSLNPDESPNPGKSSNSSDSSNEDDSSRLSEKGENPKDESGSHNDPTGNEIPGGGVMSDGPEPDYDKPEEILEEEYTLSDEDIAKIDSLIEEILNEEEKDLTEKDASYAESLDVPDLGVNYSGIKCKNIRIKSDDSAHLLPTYEKIMERLSGNVALLTNQLQRLFKNTASEKRYRNTGRVSVKRLHNGRLTCQVFERMTDPTDKSNLCVELLIDESGSMSTGRRSRCAMECAVGLAEVFFRLKIPTKVIGFTADTDHCDVVHYHYMHWLNTLNERANLMHITARSNNFDGYSIRYAAKMLEKRKEEHKLLIIISDGQPACYYYRNLQSGFIDTCDAIKEATKVADVIGVGIGKDTLNVLPDMYGKDFVHVLKPEDLFSRIGAVIQEKIKRWE